MSSRDWRWMTARGLMGGWLFLGAVMLVSTAFPGLGSAARWGLALAEMVAAVLYVVPLTARWGAFFLLVVLAIAAVVHGRAGVVPYPLGGYAFWVIITAWWGGPVGLDSDARLVQGFEDGTLPASAFGHAEHVKVAWIYLGRYPTLVALRRFDAAIRNFARQKGVPDRYHETITWAFLLLIHERRRRSASPSSWEQFASSNRDLFEPNPLSRYYREETLSSAFARHTFVLPDRATQPRTTSTSPSLTD